MDGGDERSAALHRHLASEDPDTGSAELARLWLTAYEELVGFEELVMSRLTELLPTLSKAARNEAELTNVPMVSQHLQTFRYRRAHWRKRLAELDGH